MEKIYERLDLFPMWLNYWLNKRFEYHIEIDFTGMTFSPEYLLSIYKQVGWIYYPSDQLTVLSFDAWLISIGREDLV